MSETTQAVLALILVILAIPVLRFIEKSLRKKLGSFSTFLIMMIPTLGLWILLKPTFYLFLMTCLAWFEIKCICNNASLSLIGSGLLNHLGFPFLLRNGPPVE